MNTYLITFFIKHTVIGYFLSQIRQQKSHIIQEEKIAINGNNEQIKSVLIDLIEKVNKSEFLPRRGVYYRLILDEDITMQQSVLLPNIKLTGNEIDDYVKSSLSKIFHTNDPLAYDYFYDFSQPNTKKITVFACKQSVITEYLSIFSNNKVSFIGIPNIVFNKNEESCFDDKQCIEQVICATKITGINFLPWRLQTNQLKRRNFLFVIVGYLFLCSFILGFLWYISQQRLNQQIQLSEQTKILQLQKNKQLLLLINLDERKKQLHLLLDKRKRSRDKFITILDYLVTFPSLIPEGIWLDSLEYQDNMIQLKGESFRYSDILLLSEQLNLYELIKQNKIVTVKRNGHLLQFHINTQLNNNVRN